MAVWDFLLNRSDGAKTWLVDSLSDYLSDKGRGSQPNRSFILNVEALEYTLYADLLLDLPNPNLYLAWVPHTQTDYQVGKKHEVLH